MDEDIPKLLTALMNQEGKPKLTQAELADALGHKITQPQISRWLGSKTRKPQDPERKNYKILVQYAKTVGVLPEDGEEIPKSKVIDRSKDKKGPPVSRSATEPRITKVPLLDSVTAGKLKRPLSQIPVEDVPLLAFADLGRGEFFALTVDGDSMDRISPEGSVIVVNKADRQLVGGKCYVFSHRGETTFKMWQGGDNPHLAPYSTNPSNKPIFFRKKSDLEVIGRVKRTVLDL